MGIRCADHVTPLYPQKLALTSPTGGGRSVGIVLSRIKATEFSVVLVHLLGFIIRIYHDAPCSECQIRAGRVHLRMAQLLRVTSLLITTHNTLPPR